MRWGYEGVTVGSAEQQQNLRVGDDDWELVAEAPVKCGVETGTNSASWETHVGHA